MTRYYFAGRYSRADELSTYRNQLQELMASAVVTSRWLDHHDGELEASYTPEFLNAFPEVCWQHGQADLDDLDEADVIVSFTGAGGKGGRHIEHGYALALHRLPDIASGDFDDMRLVLIGPRENIFHCHPATEQFDDWNEFITAEVARGRVS